MVTVCPRIPVCSEVKKAELIEAVEDNMPLIDNCVTLAYSQRYKSGNKYYYSFYGISNKYEIRDVTWHIANIFKLKYDYNRMLVIADENLIHDIADEFNTLMNKKVLFKEVI